jgi:hypothetical protein
MSVVVYILLIFLSFCKPSQFHLVESSLPSVRQAAAVAQQFMPCSHLVPLSFGQTQSAKALRELRHGLVFDLSQRHQLDHARAHSSRAEWGWTGKSSDSKRLSWFCCACCRPSSCSVKNSKSSSSALDSSTNSSRPIGSLRKGSLRCSCAVRWLRVCHQRRRFISAGSASCNSSGRSSGVSVRITPPIRACSKSLRYCVGCMGRV